MARHAVLVLMLMTSGGLSSASHAALQAPSGGGQYVGTWSGRWEGAGSGGGYELTIEKGQDNALIGRVSVTGEPTYKATLKKLSFDGNKMTGAYDFTPDEAGEVILSATFDQNTAKGAWSLRSKADGTEVATGTWNVTKK
jgi:hypothetical protein